MTTMHIDIQEEHKTALLNFLKTLPKDAAVVTYTSEEENSQTTSSDKASTSGEDARISGVSYVSEQDYSVDKGDFFKALKGD